jgi:hypothetical protein
MGNFTKKLKKINTKNTEDNPELKTIPPFLKITSWSKYLIPYTPIQINTINKGKEATNV